MTETATISFVGRVNARHDGFELALTPTFGPALDGLEGFSHAVVLWWAHAAASASDRDMRRCRAPYRSCTKDLGVFATRSPARPNPIGLSVIAVVRVDHESAVVLTPYIDALPGTPIIDVKPYHPSLDRAMSATVPDWCRHWPASLEDSATFDWGAEFAQG